MKKVIQTLSLVGMIVATGGALQAGEKSGEALFKANCASCHVTVHPEDESKLTAPPIMGAVRHVKMNYETKEAAVAFIVDYVQNPSKAKAACEAHTIEKFGLMPSLKGAVSEADLKKIAEYIYDTYPNGQGRGHGKGHQGGKGCQGERGHGRGAGHGGHGR
jgi:mono/diheme cytochrome c family protein